MKKLLVTTLLVVTSTVFANVAPMQAQVVFGQGVYHGQCNITRPLYVYEGCNPRTELGAAVIDCAFDVALAKCERDGNLDCIAINNSGRAWRTGSTDFPGYLRCDGSAIVRGYK